jgi:transcriptional regulator with XRE-family HTH domain
MVSLREARLRRLLTLRGLAKEAGVALNTIQFAESGRQVPRFASMRKIAAALDLEPTEIDEFHAAIEREIDRVQAAGGGTGGNREG